MACGDRYCHLAYPLALYKGDDRALYELACKALEISLLDPDRDSAVCAASAVLLNLSEMMGSLVYDQGRNAPGARALIKECGWDGGTQGLGGTCFWLSITIELMTCLRYNWTISWDPDTWGVDMRMDPFQSRLVGNEELWLRRMIYICAKVSNFRSELPESGGLNASQLNQQCQQWKTYNNLCDQWQEAVPRSMLPLSYVPWTNSSSTFAEIW